MYFYRAFNLTIQSQLELPELLLARDQDALQADVCIQWGAVCPSGLDSTLLTGVRFQANEEALWLSVPNVARYLIKNGDQIIIDPVETSDEDSIRVFLLGSCMGSLLMQRNLFLLHANAIKIGEHCISFSGPSGIGKSTLATAFLQRGYAILADDVCAINESGQVLPGFPQVKLWADASRQMSIETRSLRRIRPNLEKFSVPVGKQFYQQPLSLKMVYLLHKHNKDEIVLVNRHGSQKFNPLKNNMYRFQYLQGLGKDGAHFKQCGEIASRIHVAEIFRPDRGFQVNQLVDVIQADLRQRGLDYA